MTLPFAALSLSATLVSATNTLPSGSCRSAKRALLAKPEPKSGFCAFVLVLKLLTDVPSDVYRRVFWSCSNSTQSVPL